ncbi:MAG: transposase [Lachnospiraceae bacterium]|jgi:hypothetical protein|nr:transposase [Lachnospiraceae bacterium]
MDILEDEYKDETPGYDPECFPDCPKCGTVMGYSSVLDEFRCSKCGEKMDGSEGEFVLYAEDGMPWCCSICDGPWPDCEDSCRVFDD